MTGYLLEVKYFPNIVTPQKPQERGCKYNLPAPLLYHGGVYVCVYVRGLMLSID